MDSLYSNTIFSKGRGVGRPGQKGKNETGEAIKASASIKNAFFSRAQLALSLKHRARPKSALGELDIQGFGFMFNKKTFMGIFRNFKKSIR